MRTCTGCRICTYTTPTFALVIPLRDQWSFAFRRGLICQKGAATTQLSLKSEGHIAQRTSVNRHPGLFCAQGHRRLVLRSQGGVCPIRSPTGHVYSWRTPMGVSSVAAAGGNDEKINCVKCGLSTPLTSVLVDGIVQGTFVGLSAVSSPVSRPGYLLSKVFLRRTSFFAF
jgi:hypothetical protein